MENTDFYGHSLVDLPTLTQHIRQAEQLPVEVKLLDARIYPDGLVTLVPNPRRSKSSMSVRHFIEKYRRSYPGLDFVVPVHGRTRLDTARRRLNVQ